jgi:hypothetical protein
MAMAMSPEQARKTLEGAVRAAIPAIRRFRTTHRHALVPPEEGEVTTALRALLGTLHKAGALERPSSKGKGTLDNLLAFADASQNVRVRMDAAGEWTFDSETFLPDAGSSAIVLRTVASDLQKAIDEGRLWQDNKALVDAIETLKTLAATLEAERK